MFAETHNLIAFLEEPTESDGFEQIVDFLNANPIKCALTVSPTIYTSCLKQFWTYAKVKTVNEDVRLPTLVNGKKVNLNEASIRRDLRLDDAKDTACLPNAAIFEELARMGYEKPSQKLTFYKKIFSPQWKFLIHTILQCLSAKTNVWNEFSNTVASAIIYLANNQKFNFSMYIFESMMKNLEVGVKFLMKHKSKRKQRKETKISQDGPPTEEHIPTPSHNPLPSEVETKKLKKGVKKLKGVKKKRTYRLKRLYKGRINKEDLFGVHDLDGNELIVDITAGENVEQDATIAEKEDDVTLAQTLIEIKAAKPREVQAKIDADIELAQKLQTKEQEQLTDVEKARLFMEFLEKRRKFFARKRQIKKRNRPPTKAQQRNLMSMKKVNTFLDMNTKIVEERLKKTQVEVTEGGSKRAKDEIEQESAKRQRLEKEDDSAELKRCLEIVPEDDDDVPFKATPLSSKSPTIVD
nr:hypothetical protein [Tanacetum cinerariifolium]